MKHCTDKKCLELKGLLKHEDGLKMICEDWLTLEEKLAETRRELLIQKQDNADLQSLARLRFEEIERLKDELAGF